MPKEQITYRFAEREDVPLILKFIKELAKYEKMEHEVVAQESDLKEWIFDKKRAEVIFAVVDEKEIGFALFFHNFSTFLGRAGIYLEDLYIMPEYRGKVMEKPHCRNLLRLRLREAVGVWSGGVLTGTGQVLISTYPWAQSQ